MIRKTSSERVERIDDYVPSITRQSTNLGASLRWVDPSVLLPDDYHYNASITPDGHALVYRRESNLVSTIGVCELDENARVVPETNRALALPRSGNASRNRFEDPRAFEHAGEAWISYVHVIDSNVSIHLARLDRDWRVVDHVVPTYGGNDDPATIQKNWSFFSHGDELLFVYLSDPHEVVRLGDEVAVGRTDGVRWPYGIVRGGTPPFRVDDVYVTFFHSRRKDDSRWRYYLGAYAFEAQAPFRPVAMTHEPLLAASGRDPQLRRLPLVVFPCGATKRGDQWTVSLGVNDVAIAFLSMDHGVLKRAMGPVERATSPRTAPALISLPGWLG